MQESTLPSLPLSLRENGPQGCKLQESSSGKPALGSSPWKPAPTFLSLRGTEFQEGLVIWDEMKAAFHL